MDFGEKMIEFRKQYDLTQEELAGKLFVTRQAVSLWEQGKALPSLDTLRRLRKLYGISVDEWICGENATAPTKDMPGKHCVLRRKTVRIIVSVVAALALISIIAFGSASLISRAKLLRPDGTEDITVTRKQAVVLTKTGGGSVAFSESGKPEVLCRIPDGFIAKPDSPGLYTDANGNYIRINSDYGKNVFDPLSGTSYSAVFEEAGYASYIEKVRMAMYTDPRRVSVFASKKNILSAGGSRILRSTICAGQDADFYELDGGLTDDSSGMRISGFLLDFGNGARLVTLCDSNGNHCFLTVSGISAESLNELLNTIEMK